MTVFFSQFGDNWTWPTTTESGSGHENPQPFSLFANGWNVSALLMILATAFTIFNVKSLPGMWHMRIVNAFRFILRTQRPPIEPSSTHIFQPLITSSSAPLLEIDFNLHKSNSSYFSDLDISRTHLVCTLFADGIAKMRGGTKAYTGSKDPSFGLALGAVSCNFRREIMPYQKYDMWSKILSWDEKWLYIVTHFAKPSAAHSARSSLYPETGRVQMSTHDENQKMGSKCERAVFATAISKCVFKSGRKTVCPDQMLRLSGLLSPDGETKDCPSIEARRRTGLLTCRALAAENQKALEEEFGNVENDEVLGRHTDGAGIFGVVSTLLQLAKLKTNQTL